MIRVITDFITEQEEKTILHRVPRIVRRNNGVMKRNIRYRIYRTDDMVQMLQDRIMEKTPMTWPENIDERPECVLLSEYLPGNGYGMHRDPSDRGGCSAILNLHGEATLAFSKEIYTAPSVAPPDESMEQFVLPRRSLIYFDGDDFYKRSHGVFPVKGLRYSIIFWRT